MIKEFFLDFMNGLDIYLKSHYTGEKELVKNISTDKAIWEEEIL